MNFLKKIMDKFFPICIFIFLTPISFITHAATFLEIDADPDEFLFQGKDINVTAVDGDFSLYYSDSNQLSGGFTWAKPAADKYNIQLSFYSGAQRALGVGAYLNAQGPSWMSGQIEPALNVYLIGAGRGCNPNIGEFIIYEFEPKANPPRYAINFTQDCLAANKAKIHGILRVNSNYPKQDANPIASISLPSAKAIEGKQYNVSAEKSRAQVGDIIAYEWRQLSGPAMTFIDSASSTAHIILPKNLPLGGANVVLQLTVTNTSGNKATTQVPFHVDSKSDPQSFFYIVSDTKAPLTDTGWLVKVEQNNLINVVGGSWGIFANISTSTSKSPDYYLSMDPPVNQNLQPRSYLNAKRMASATGGLDFAANGYGCNESLGEFEVLSIENEGDLLTQFHARFTHSCGAPTTGEIAFNVFDPNVPIIKIAVPKTIIEGDTVTLDASASVDNIGSIASYLWTGPGNITIQNSGKAIASFKAPAVNGAESASFTFKLHVTDNEGYQSEKTVTLAVLPKPKTSSSASNTSSSTASSANASVSNTNETGSKSGGGAIDLWFYFGLLVMVIRVKRHNI